MTLVIYTFINLSRLLAIVRYYLIWEDYVALGVILIVVYSLLLLRIHIKQVRIPIWLDDLRVSTQLGLNLLAFYVLRQLLLTEALVWLLAEWQLLGGVDLCEASVHGISLNRVDLLNSLLLGGVWVATLCQFQIFGALYGEHIIIGWILLLLDHSLFVLVKRLINIRLTITKLIIQRWLHYSLLTTHVGICLTVLRMMIQIFKVWLIISNINAIILLLPTNQMSRNCCRLL